MFGLTISYSGSPQYLPEYDNMNMATEKNTHGYLGDKAARLILNVNISFRQHLFMIAYCRKQPREYKLLLSQSS